MNIKYTLIFVLVIAQGLVSLSAAPTLTEAQKAKVSQTLDALKSLGTDPQVVQAVKDANANPPAAYKNMTQDTWKGLSILSAEIKFFTKNPLVDYLKTKKTASMTELFVSAADGTKVGFFAKTSSWTHKGKAKHDDPMAGKTWIGDPEQDESTGKVQVQIAFPVLDGKKAIGSVVIGLDIEKL